MTEPLKVENILDLTAVTGEEEDVSTLLTAAGLTLERIVSTGQSTPEGMWYDQEKAEWVVLLKGSAGVRFEHDATTHTLAPGDALLIPAHARHRVEWTDPEHATVWLALHYRQSITDPSES